LAKHILTAAEDPLPPGLRDARTLIKWARDAIIALWIR
jgi:hypothetical protein